MAIEDAPRQSVATIRKGLKLDKGRGTDERRAAAELEMIGQSYPTEMIVVRAISAAKEHG